MIISDALRYEVAHELQGQINEAKRFAAKITSQLGVLPSYTQLGMAALLPHQQIDYAQGSATVLVDGQSSAGLDNRSAILAKVGALRYQPSRCKVGPALRPMRRLAMLGRSMCLSRCH